MKIGFVLTFLLTLSLATSAGASILNSVSLTNGGGGVAGCGSEPSQGISNQPNTINGSLNSGAINCTLSLEATAGGGFVSARGTLNGSGVGQAAAGARSSMNQIFLTPLFDVDNPRLPFNQNFLIPVTLNAGVEAVMSGVADATGFNNWQGGAGASVQGFAELSGFSSPNNSVFGRSTFNERAGVAVFFDVDADSATLSQSLASTLTIDWRFPLSVLFNLGGDLSINGFGLPNQTGSFDASNTLSFSKTGPAFILPEGFTVDAPELNIVNNQWIDPRVTAVPLPASFFFLLSGLVGLGLVRRRA